MAAAVRVFTVTEDEEYQEFLEWREFKRRRQGKVVSPAGDRPRERTNLELWDTWYPTVKDSARGPNIKTHRAYCMLLEFEFGGRTISLGQLTPSECTPEIIETWRAALRGIVSKLRKKPLAPEYRHGIRMSMSAMWTYYVGIKSIPANPLHGIPLEEGWKGRRRKGYSTKEKMDVFLPHCRPILAAMHLLSYRSGGMRRDEMRLLKKQEIRWDRGTIQLGEDRNKNGEAREIILTGDDIKMLEHFCALSPSDYVFANPNDRDGGPVPKSTLWGWQEEARQEAGQHGLLNGEPWVMHSNRHGYVMRMLPRAPRGWIAEQVGHKNGVMIDEVYGRMRTEEDRERYREIAEKDPTPAPERLPPKAAPAPVIPRHQGRNVGRGE